MSVSHLPDLTHSAINRHPRASAFRRSSNNAVQDAPVIEKALTELGMRGAGADGEAARCERSLTA
jgi:hypothetical protein